MSVDDKFCSLHKTFSQCVAINLTVLYIRQLYLCSRNSEFSGLSLFSQSLEIMKLISKKEVNASSE